MRLAPVLTSLELPLPELMAATLDGELFAAHGLHSPVDEPDGTARRAATAAALLPARAIACRTTAAWVWGALSNLPARLEASTPIGSRYRAGPASGLVMHEIGLEPDEVTRCGPLLLTVPRRTAADLALLDAGSAVLIALARAGDFELEEVLEALTRRRKLPGKHAGIRTLERAIADRPLVSPS